MEDGQVGLQAEVFERLLDFLNRLDPGHIHYTLGHTRPESVMVDISLPGWRWEVEFMLDGSTEIERYKSVAGAEDDPSPLEEETIQLSGRRMWRLYNCASRSWLRELPKARRCIGLYMRHLSLEGFRIRATSQGSKVGEYVLEELTCPWMYVAKDLSAASQGVFIQSKGIARSAEFPHVRR